MGKTDGLETKKNENQKLYYHRIGQNQSEDILVAELLENPLWRMYTLVSDCGKYLIVMILRGGVHNLIYTVDLEATGEIKGKLDLVPVITKFEADYHVSKTINIFSSIYLW